MAITINSRKRFTLPHLHTALRRGRFNLGKRDCFSKLANWKRSSYLYVGCGGDGMGLEKIVLKNFKVII